jgi:hypothetical protein
VSEPRSEVAGSREPSAPGAAPPPHRLALQMQILTTEHWSLLASRSLAWSESFSRAGMYLSTLSGAMVALGLVGSIDRFGAGFSAFALVVLPVLLFVGLGTFLRMNAVNYHDALAVAGMNRIRAAYLEVAPELAPYFVMGTHDDPPGIAKTMAIPPRTPSLVHVVSATPFLVIALNGMVAGALAAVLAGAGLGLGQVPSLGVAGSSWLVAVALQLGVVRANMRGGRESLTPMFPTPAAPVDERAP